MSGTTFLRTSAVAISLACIPLAGCASATKERPAASAPRNDAGIPFTSASAELLPDGSGYRVTWQAPQARKVSVFAGTGAAPSAVGGATGSVIIPGDASSSRAYFTLIPDQGEPLVIADRNLHLATVPNWRDVGGYRTADGQWVVMGKIYRADQLDKVSDADLARLAAINTAVVIDLRTQSERTREPDKIPANARGLVLDVAADSAGSLGGDMRGAMEAIAAGKGVEMLTSANREFITLPSARKAYAAMLREMISENKGAIVYHCTAGKDRTGWATALILTLLGVPRDTVMADYMLSNTYLKDKNAATAAMFAKAGAPFPIENLEAVMTVRPEFLQAAFDEVDKSYGSVDAYVRQGLGLSETEIVALKKKYLTGVPG